MAKVRKRKMMPRSWSASICSKNAKTKVLNGGTKLNGPLVVGRRVSATKAMSGMSGTAGPEGEEEAFRLIITKTIIGRMTAARARARTSIMRLIGCWCGTGWADSRSLESGMIPNETRGMIGWQDGGGGGRKIMLPLLERLVRVLSGPPIGRVVKSSKEANHDFKAVYFKNMI